MTTRKQHIKTKTNQLRALLDKHQKREQKKQDHAPVYQYYFIAS